VSPLRCLVEGTGEPLVKRKVLVFRRLEPGDVRTPGTHALPHSPYLEAKVLDLALSQSFFDDLVRVEAKRREVLGSGDASLLHRFDIPGMIIAGAGATLVGTTMGYAPVAFRPALLGILAVGVALAFVTRFLKARAEGAAREAWKAMPEAKEDERLGRELAEAWARFSAQVKREHEGFHTELRVGEGSTAPQRLCALDPRGFLARPPTFDSQDWLPTVGGGVRYEEIDVMGELVTRGLEGVDDWGEDRKAPSEAAGSATAATTQQDRAGTDDAPAAEAASAAEADADAGTERAGDGAPHGPAAAGDDDEARGEPASDARGG
jgi:hypothetical protein